MAKHENHLSEDTPRWFAVYTKYKSEKEVARRLARKGIECYVPINRVVREYTRKRKIVELPLINCYIFVRIRKPEYVPVLETEFVSKFIHFAKDLLSIPEEEIQLLKRVCQEYGEIDTVEAAFRAGQPVEIVGGNLTGVKGIMVSDLGKNFLLELEHIGIGLRIEVDPRFIKPVQTWKDTQVPEGQGSKLAEKYWS